MVSHFADDVINQLLRQYRFHGVGDSTSYALEKV